MKRTDITEMFPEATQEQIDKLMGINGADINAAKREVGSLQTQIAEMQERLSKPSDELTAAKKQARDLQTEIDKLKAAETLRRMREKVSSETEVPADLLTGATEEDCNTQAQAIMAFVKKRSGYPDVRHAEDPTEDTPQSTRDQFAAWFNNQ